MAETRRLVPAAEPAPVVLIVSHDRAAAGFKIAETLKAHTKEGAP